MAQQTALSPMGTPGKTYPSFAGKTPAVGGVVLPIMSDDGVHDVIFGGVIIR